MEHNVDINGDGKVTEAEFEIFKKKIDTQRKLADASMTAMIVFTAVLMTPFVPVDRVNALSDVFSMFYVAMGGVVAAFYGVSAWMGRK